MKEGKLFDQFPPVSAEEWMEKVRSDLKGADFNKKMVWRTGGGLDVMPFYRAEDLDNMRFIDSRPGDFPFIRGTKTDNNRWKIRQDIEVSDYSSANKKALEILMKGVDSIGFLISDPESVNEDNFRTLLKDIHLESIEANFRCAGKAKEILDILINNSRNNNLDFAEINGAIETDPLSRLMINGTLCIPVEAGFDYLADLTRSSEVFPGIRTIHLNASNFCNAGADIVMELAFGISMGSEYLAQLSDRGVSPALAGSKIRFSFGVGSSYFLEIAKLRAARILWSAVTNAFFPDKSGVPMAIHCVTSEWNKAVFDPYVNMLRTQTEAMSAILGGTDSLTIEPFDIVFRQPDEFSERIARNQQLILREESYFDKVADPAAGSYYIEKLTQMISESAWKLFVWIEEQGGFLTALRSGLIQKKLSESADRKKADLAFRRSSILGINQYPNTAEPLPRSFDPERSFRKEREKDEMTVEPIDIFRGSEEYERIRIAVLKSEKQPLVFLLTIGNAAMRKARANFACSFFGCAGYKVLDNFGFSTVEEGVKSALASEADIVVICSSDEEYPVYAPYIFAQLKGKAIAVIAGNPALAEDLKTVGLDLFIHLRSNVPETLRYFNKRLGIKE